MHTSSDKPINGQVNRSENGSVNGPIRLQFVIVTAGLATLAIALSMILPRTAPASLALILATAVMTSGMQRPIVTALPRPPLAIVCVLALATWAVISAMWAADRGEALGKGLMLTAFAAAVWATGVAVGSAKRDGLERIGRAIALTFGGCLLFLMFEEATGHALKRFAFEVVPLLMPSRKMLAGGDHERLVVSSYITNRNMAAVALLLWPCLYLIRRAASAQMRLPVTLATVGVAFAATALSAHETSIIAIGASGLVLALALRLPRFALGLVAAGWFVATMLMIPMVSLAFHSANLHAATWLPNSARHRIVLWAYTAEQTAQHPLIGIGAASTKVIDARRGPRVDVLAGTRFEWRSTPHAHNVYLQTWYELGAVGAILLLALGLSLLHGIRAMGPVAMPLALATLTSSALTASFSWGMWQAWFLALYAVAAVIMLLASAISSNEPDGTSVGLGGRPGDAGT